MSKPQNEVIKLAFRWYHYAGGFGAILTILGLIWAVYSHFDMQAHDRDMEKKAIEAQEAGKSDVQINVDIPDINVDKTVEEMKVLTEKAKEVTADMAENAKMRTKEGVAATKRYWESKRDIFKAPAELFNKEKVECDPASGETHDEICLTSKPEGN